MDTDGVSVNECLLVDNMSTRIVLRAFNWLVAVALACATWTVLFGCMTGPMRPQATHSDPGRALARIHSPQPTTEPAARYALVIGNGDYTHVAPLNNTLNDARGMRSKLVALGFSVSYLEQAKDRRSFVEAVHTFSDSLMRRPQSVGLFYYAGHALQLNGENYLIPTDVIIRNEADVEFETFAVNQLLQYLDQAKNAMNIVILDSCRNNPFARGFRGESSRGLAPLDSPSGSIVIFATAPGDVASDGNGDHGTFTKHLLEYIDQPGLTIEQMLKRVRSGVLEETYGRQTPWETSSLQGEFCFAGCADLDTIVEDRLQSEKERLTREREALRAQREALERAQAEAARTQRNQTGLEEARRAQADMAAQRRRLEEERAALENEREYLERVRQEKVPDQKTQKPDSSKSDADEIPVYIPPAF